MGGHAQGIEVVLAVQLRDAVDALGDVAAAGLPQLGQVDHQALAGIVADNALRALKNHVGAGAGVDGGGQDLIAVLIVDGVDFHGDVGVFRVECGNQGIPAGGVGKAADIERPQGDRGLSSGGVRAAAGAGAAVAAAAGRQAQHHG